MFGAGENVIQVLLPLLKRKRLEWSLLRLLMSGDKCIPAICVFPQRRPLENDFTRTTCMSLNAAEGLVRIRR